MASRERPLLDAPSRSYVTKLDRFSRFAEPELRQIVASFDLSAVRAALDLGCGTGLMASLLQEALGSHALVVGLDLSKPHLDAAKQQHDLSLVQCDIERLCIADAAFDFTWCCNTINHVLNQGVVLETIKKVIRPGGVLALAQSGMLPEMFFAWDSHLDDAVRTACHRYYRERYNLDLADTADVRAILGLLKSAGFERSRTRTYVIERTSPLTQVDKDYFREAVFDGLWGEKIVPFLDERCAEKLERYCNPGSPDYCLDRDDFHHIQTLTVCEGFVPS